MVECLFSFQQFLQFPYMVKESGSKSEILLMVKLQVSLISYLRTFFIRKLNSMNYKLIIASYLTSTVIS